MHTACTDGGLVDPEDARSAIEDGADLLTLGKSALANPDWPERVRDHEVPAAADQPADD